MALIDFIDRRAFVQIGPQVITLKPVTVLGMITVQSIVEEILHKTEETDTLVTRYNELDVAIASEDEAKVTAALARLYLEILDGIGRDRFAQIIAVISEPSDVSMIRAAIEADPFELPKVLMQKVGELHDIPRLIPHLAKMSSGSGDSDSMIGHETFILSLCHFLPQYTFSDILAWPYERFLSAIEQKDIIERHMYGAVGEEKDIGSSANELLINMGVRVSGPPKKQTVN